jgi:transcriptional regulator with XRE-family HTH domain
MFDNVQPLYKNSQGICTLVDMVSSLHCGDYVRMPYKARHFLREWREFKGLTLEELAERVETLGAERNQQPTADLTFPDTMTHVTLSRIENGKQPYKQQLLEILADIYGTDPASLVSRNPFHEDQVQSIWDRIPEEQREQAKAILLTFAQGKRTGTDG